MLGLDGVATPTEGMDYYEFRVDGRGVGGLMPMIGDMWPDDLPNHWMVYFAVDDTDAIAARCVELGGQAPVPPTDIPPGRFAVLTDPQGGHLLGPAHERGDAGPGRRLRPTRPWLIRASRGTRPGRR